MVFVCVHCHVVCKKQVKLIVLHVCTSHTCACTPVRKTMIADVSRMPQRRRGSKVVTGFGGGFRSKRLEEEQSSSSKWFPPPPISAKSDLYTTPACPGVVTLWCFMHCLATVNFPGYMGYACISVHDLCTRRSTEETDDENGKANVSECNSLYDI